MPEIDAKERLPLSLPMIRDREEQRIKQRDAAELIVQRLRAGKNVAFLTLGDPSVYSTYTYLHRLVDKEGYKTKIIPGVTSFCAAAASLGEDLVNGEDALHIIPGFSDEREAVLNMRGSRVLMKTGKSIDAVRGMLREQGRKTQVSVVANCGMENERVWKSIDDMEAGENPGYFTLIIIKDREQP
jgi:precorrin-2/cobalt-factor-2 C20-methyltransferase